MNAQPSLFPSDVSPPEPGEKRVLTIGHSTRPLDDFLALLAHYRVGRLVDIRHFPTSRHNPQFNKGSLAGAAAQHGIEYHWLQLLGGYRSTGYLAYMETDDFRQGIAKLEELATTKPTAYMCAEVKWYRCHRRHVSDTLEQHGWRVIHIIDQNRAEPHTEKHNVIKCD